MSYPITVNLIPGLPRNPYRKGVSAYEGVVAHATDNTAPAINERNYEASGAWQDAFVHFFVDWASIIQVADTDYKCWGCGPEGNARYVQVELCQTSDPNLFQESYKRYCWLLAKILHDKNMGVTDGVTLVSHDWVSKNLGGTNHTDPIAYFASHNVTWAQFVKDVADQYTAMNPVVKPLVIVKNGWVKENNQWLYYVNDGKKTGWIQDKGKWYFLDDKGIMQTGYIVTGGKAFFLTADGSMLDHGTYTLGIAMDGSLLPPHP